MGAVPQRYADTTGWAEEAERCLEMRVCGCTYRQIAERMTADGYPMSHQTARVRVEWAVNRIITPGVEELRKVEGERLDLILRSLLPLVAAGDPAAAAVWLRASDARRKLFGLDIPVPKQVDVTVTERTQEDVELDEMIAEVRAAQAARENTPG